MRYAAKGGHVDIVKLMIEKGAKSGSRMNWNYGMRGAVKGGHIDIVKLMIEKEPKAVPEWIETGMYYAEKGGHKDMVELIRSYKI